MSKIEEKIIEIANDNDWKVSFDHRGNETNIEFESYTPSGQDLIVNLWITDLDSLEDVRDSVYSYWEGFDECKETYNWLDSDGHGINGAPYHMGDVLEDMVNAKQMIYHLSEAFK